MLRRKVLRFSGDEESMRYVYLIIFLIALMPAAAITQTNTSGNYRLVLSTDPEQVVVNTPIHMHLHIQDIETGNTVGNLDVKELLVHLQEHESNVPHIVGQNLSEIHRDIPHKEMLDMRGNPDEPPGHYHTNYTFNETGAYEVVVQFKGNGNTVSSIFSIDVKPAESKREPLKTRYELFGILAASVIVIAAVAIAFRKIVEIFNIK